MERSNELNQRDWLSLMLFLLVYSIGVWHTAVSLFERWLKLDESYSHGLAILGVSGFIFFRKWLDYRPATGFYPFWLIPFVISSVIYITGSITLVDALEELALLPTLMSGLMVLWGWKQSCRFFMPITLLAFALPIWDYLAWPLQLMTVEVNQFLLSFLGIEFYVDGIFIHFPKVGAFEIAHGCSGLRYWLVGLAISVIYGEISYKVVKNRIFLLLLGMSLALLANWIRVFVIIYVGFKSNMTSPLIGNHEVFGWWVFAGTLVPLFLFARWFEKKEANNPLQESDTNFDRGCQQKRNRHKGRITITLFTSGFALAVWTLSPSLHSDYSISPGDHEVKLSLNDEWLPLFQRDLMGWDPVMKRDDRRYVQNFASHARHDQFGAPAEELLIGLYSYDYQQPGREVVQHANRIFDSSNFVLEERFRPASEDQLAGLVIKQRESGKKIFILYSYYVEGLWGTNDLEAKFAQLPGILNERTDASLLVIGLSCTNCDGKKRVLELAPRLKEAIHQYLDQLYASHTP